MNAPDPSTEYRPFLIEAIDGSLDWGGLFRDDRPRELEIGSGKGLFLTRAGQARADRNFVGIELARKYARRAAERIAKTGLANVRVIWGDARRLVTQSVPTACVEAVHVYFPDPWWKKRHKKRRLMQSGFIEQLVRVLRAGGLLHFTSDVESYFQETLTLLRAQGSFFEHERPAEKVAQHDLDYLTHFERKYRLEGRPIYRALFERLPAPAPADAGLERRNDRHAQPG